MRLRQDAAAGKAQAIAQVYGQSASDSANHKPIATGFFLDVKQKQDARAEMRKFERGFFLDGASEETDEDEDSSRSTFGIEDLMSFYDSADADQTGFALLSDLRLKIESFIQYNPNLAELAATLRGIDAMILDRDDFEELANGWLYV